MNKYASPSIDPDYMIIIITPPIFMDNGLVLLATFFTGKKVDMRWHGSWR
jgi:hypothetical protein